MIIEIYRPLIKQHGDVETCIKKELYTIWTPDRIKKAFNNGHGTEKDFKQHQKDNAHFCVYMEAPQK